VSPEFPVSVVSPEFPRWDDATLGIEWPLIEGQAPLLSGKDQAGQLFAEAEVYDEGFDYRR